MIQTILIMKSLNTWNVNGKHNIIKMGIEETLGRLTPLADYLHYLPPLYDTSTLLPFMIYLAAYPLFETDNYAMEQFRKYLKTPLNEIP